MATAKTTDFTKPIADAFGEYQTKAKAAYEKSTEVATEVTEFAKGNVEAIVESSKIFAAGAQTLGKTYVEEAKSAYETMTADVKELAAVKSPTELFQLQGKIAAPQLRRAGRDQLEEHRSVHEARQRRLRAADRPRRSRDREARQGRLSDDNFPSAGILFPRRNGRAG